MSESMDVEIILNEAKQFLDSHADFPALHNTIKVNVLPPIEAGASCFNENSATDSKELRRLTLSPQA